MAVFIPDCDSFRQIFVWCTLHIGLHWWLSGKESACNVGATGEADSIPESERAPGGGHRNPFQYSCMDSPSRISVLNHVLASNVPLIYPYFLEEITSLSHSIVFPLSLHCAFKKAFLSLLGILWISAFSWIYLSFIPLPFMSLLPSAIWKASSDDYFAFLYFFFSFGMVWSLPPVLC